MSRRTHEGPMDFEWENHTGPLDARSPFTNLSVNQPGYGNPGRESPGKKRGVREAFGSPPKSDLPSLRSPYANQSHAFSQPTFPPSPTKSIFSTPRRFNSHDAQSSGGETPQSPSHDQSLLDSDATPDHNSLNFRGLPARFEQAPMPSVPNGCTKSPTRLKDKKLEQTKAEDKRRNSWWSRAAEFVSSSPSTEKHHAISGKGEIARGHKDDKVVKKAVKKRRGDAVRQLIRMRRESVSESEDSRPPSPSKSRRRFGLKGRKDSDSSAGDAAPSRPNDASKGAWWNVAAFLTQHPTLPQILSWYAQLTLNMFLVCGAMYMLWSFYSTVRSDIDKKSSEAVGELLAEMAICAKQYTENRCDPETRVPAMETVCSNWEKCMRQDTKALGRARISVGMWAEIFNGFVEPITWKTMFFTIIIISGAITLSNLPFSMIRHRADQAAAANHHHYYGNVPPTPGRQFSNPALDQGYWTPHHGNQGLEPAPSQGFGQIEGRESPVKRLQFR